MGMCAVSFFMNFNISVYDLHLRLRLRLNDLAYIVSNVLEDFL
jgi:hypothetical protein